MSGFIFTGLAGMYWSTGIPLLANFICVFVVYIAIFFTQGLRLRVASRVLDAVTIPDFFENRFKDTKHILRWSTSVIMIVGVTVYVMSQFSAGSSVISVLFGWDKLVGLIVTAVFVIGYTTTGGFFAVCWTDFVQGIIMCLASTTLAVLALDLTGGFNEGYQMLVNMNEAGTLDDNFLYGWKSIINLLSWASICMGTFGYPHVNVRFMAAKDTRTSIKMMPLVMIIMAFFGTGTAIAGIFGRAIYPDTAMLINNNAEMLYVTMFMDHLPGLLSGIFIAGIVAAVMSTADSLLLVASSAFANDIVYKIFKTNLTEEQVLRIGRWTTVGIGLVAFGLTFISNASIFFIASHAWTWLGALGPGMILALFWKRTTKIGVLVGFFGAIIIGTAWAFAPALMAVFQPTGVAITAGLILTWLFSLITPPEKKEVQDLVDLFNENATEKHLDASQAAAIEMDQEEAPRYMPTGAVISNFITNNRSLVMGD